MARFFSYFSALQLCYRKSFWQRKKPAGVVPISLMQVLCLSFFYLIF